MARLAELMRWSFEGASWYWICLKSEVILALLQTFIVQAMELLFSAASGEYCVDICNSFCECVSMPVAYGPQEDAVAVIVIGNQ
jgi:hypothetical protein